MMLVKDDVMLVTLRVTGKRSSYFILIHALCCPPLGLPGDRSSFIWFD